MQATKKENFVGSINSMPKLKESYNSSLFMSFYPNITGEDFKLYEFNQKLKANLKPAALSNITIRNGIPHRSLTESSDLTPVILVPGIGATPIYATWYKTTAPPSIKTLNSTGQFEKSEEWSCKQSQPSFTEVWWSDFTSVDTSSLGGYCWADNIRVVPGADSKGIANSEGVRTTTDAFGTAKFGLVYDSFINVLESMGYNLGDNLFGAGYDFRRISDQAMIDDWCLSMTKLIERTVGIHSKPVVIIGHDLGAMIANYFLVTSDDKWKKKFIKSFVNVNGTFGGCPKALRTVLSGSNEEVHSSMKEVFTVATRNFAGLAMMLPYPEIYGDTPLVHFNEVTYTSYDIPKLLKKVSEETATLYQSSEKIRKKSMGAPKVPVYMVLGDDISTEGSYKYDKSLMEQPELNAPYYQMDLPNSQEFNYGDIKIGDGVMPRFALEYPITWSKHQSEPIFYQFFSGAGHNDILSMHDPMVHIVKILKGEK